MVRGIFTGVIWGGVVSFGLVSVANEVFDVVTPEQVAQAAQSADVAEAPADTSQSTPDSAGMDRPADTTDETTDRAAEAGADSVPDTAQEMAPDADGDAPAEEAPAQTPTDEDAAENDATDSDAMDNSADAADAAPSDTEQTPAPIAPSEPEVGQLPGLETPETPNGSTLPGATPDAMPGEDPVLAPPLAQSPESPAPDEAPQAETNAPDNSPNNSKTIKVGDAAPETGPDTAPDTAPDVAGQGTEMAVIDDDLLTPNPDADPDTGTTPQSGIGEKVGSFTERDDDRISSRLPTVAPAGTAGEIAPTVSAEDLPALLAHSSNYTAAPAGPIVSVILVDIGAIPADDPALRNLPFPVALAVDALAPGADERAFSYRNADLEVLSMVALPEGATPQDVAVSFSQAREVVPVSIGFLDIPSAAFQNSREIAKQVIASAQEGGHGVVSFPLGLNALEAEAQRAKAPAGFIFRDFDGRGQDVSAMKRFLDQAAFRAGVEGKIVMLARAKPDTIQAMAEWSLGNRAKTVSIVPLSYLLSRDDD